MERVKVHRNALPVELINELKTLARSTQHVRLNYTSWEPTIVKNSSAVFIVDIEGDIKERLMGHVLPHLPELPSNTKVAAMMHGWSAGSFIPWHEDNPHLFGATIYLNEEWDRDWGGYLAYEDGDKTYCLKPEFNTMVTLIPPIKHTVFAVGSVAPIRETIQIFGMQR